MADAQGDELISVDPANDVTLQITQVEDLISQGIDAMFMNPAEAEGILPALDQLKEAGIPIIGFDTEVADLSYLASYTGSDNYNAVHTSGGKLFDEEKAQMSFTEPHVLDALKYIKRLNDLNRGQSVTQEDFDKGNVAFMPLTFAEYRTYKTYLTRLRNTVNSSGIVLPFRPEKKKEIFPAWMHF